MPPGDKGSESWLEWSKYLIKSVESLSIKVDSLKIEVAELKVKSGIWGLVGGLIPVIIMIAIYFITKK